MNIQSLASGSGGNAYIVSDERTTIMIDCGITFKQLERGAHFALSSIDGVLISHEHEDHCKALKDCLRFGMDCYAPEEVFAKKKIVAHKHRCHVVKPLKSFTIGTFMIVPFDLDHDVVNMGFVLHSKWSGERLMYFTDTFQVKYRFDGVTHLMAEANYGEQELAESAREGKIPVSVANRIAATHMSLERLLAFLEANDTSNMQSIYLIHLSKNNSHHERFKAAVEDATGCNVYICT